MAKEKPVKREEAIINWFKKPDNAVLIGIITLAFVVRLYHFIITLNQPLWWDEAEYLAASKHFAFGIPYVVNPQRPPFFQMIAGFFLKIGLGEPSIKFFLVLIPSVFLVWAVYLLGKEMYNKKIGLIASFLTALSWTLLFWTSRMQPDYISMSFQVLAVFFMWKFWKNNKTLPIVLAGAFSAISFMFKVSGLLIPLIFAIFILGKDRLSAFKNKKYYYFAITFLLFLSPLFIWNFTQYGDPLATRKNYSPVLETNEPFKIVQNLTFYYLVTENVLFVLFILGLILGLKFLLYSDILLKDKKKIFNPDIFSVLVLIVVSLFYMFWIKETQDRWVFLWLPFIFFLTGKASLSIYDYLKKYGKVLSALLVLALLLIAGYSNYHHATTIIEGKKDSYEQIKQAGIWLKENSNPQDIIFSRSQPQMSYYSERKIVNFNSVDNPTPNLEDLNLLLDKYHPEYIMVSIYETNPVWMQDWIIQNQAKLTPVHALFADRSQQQATVVIYQISY